MIFTINYWLFYLRLSLSLFEMENALYISRPREHLSSLKWKTLLREERFTINKATRHESRFIIEASCANNTFKMMDSVDA